MHFIQTIEAQIIVGSEVDQLLAIHDGRRASACFVQDEIGIFRLQFFSHLPLNGDLLIKIQGRKVSLRAVGLCAGFAGRRWFGRGTFGH